MYCVLYLECPLREGPVHLLIVQYSIGMSDIDILVRNYSERKIMRLSNCLYMCLSIAKLVMISVNYVSRYYMIIASHDYC